MFYAILLVVLILFYLLVAPKNIRSTINLIILGFFLVAAVLLFILGFLRIVQSPPEVWIGLIMTFLGLAAVWDIHHMKRDS